MIAVRYTYPRIDQYTLPVGQERQPTVEILPIHFEANLVRAGSTHATMRSLQNTVAAGPG